MRLIRLLLAGLLFLPVHDCFASDRSLSEFQNESLQHRLTKSLQANKQWDTLIRKQRMSVCLLDMSHAEPQLASVNGDKMMYAASLPKIAILLAAYAAFEDGSLQESAEIRQDLGDMIRVSSNSAATRMIDRIGMRKIQRVLQDPAFRFYDENDGGGLWLGKRFATQGNRIGDPLYNISHGATALQTCRFFYLLASGQMINAARSEEMLIHLSKPDLHHKFVSQTDRLAPKASVYRKSGSWRRWHSDAIWVVGQNWRNYILVALVESRDGEQIIRQVLPVAERVLQGK